MNMSLFKSKTLISKLLLKTILIFMNTKNNYNPFMNKRIINIINKIKIANGLSIIFKNDNDLYVNIL